MMSGTSFASVAVIIIVIIIIMVVMASASEEDTERRRKSLLPQGARPSRKASIVAESLMKLAGVITERKVAIWYSGTSDAQTELLSLMLAMAEIPIVINTSERPDEEGIEIRASNELVIILNDIPVERVLQETLWNDETRFLILSDDMSKVKSDFEGFWKFKVVNVYEMVATESSLVIYSFLPYDKEDCGIGDPFPVDTYLMNQGYFAKGGSAFKESIRVKNMNQCVINVTIVDVRPNVIFEDDCDCNGSFTVQGIEGKLMTEVAKRMNFRAFYVTALDGIGWGWIRPTPHGTVGEVYTGRSDFGIGLLAPTIERYEALDLSLPFTAEECITYGVPSGAGVSTPYWITILVFEFTPVTWLLILLSFVFIFYVFYGMNIYLRRTWFPQKSDIFLYEFSSFLGLPIKVPDYAYLKLAVLTWILYSFVVTVAYKSSISSRLTVPNVDPDINTFEELLQSPLQLTGYNNMLRLLQYNDSEPTIEKMKERFKVTDYNLNTAVNLIITERKIAYVRHASTFLYHALTNQKSKHRIHIMTDCILSYYPVVVTKKHSPFSERLNQLIRGLVESGISHKWSLDYIYILPPPPRPFLKLSYSHTYGVFCILCIGYSFGFLLLLTEILTHKCKKYRKPKRTHSADSNSSQWQFLFNKKKFY